MKAQIILLLTCPLNSIWSTPNDLDVPRLFYHCVPCLCAVLAGQIRNSSMIHPIAEVQSKE